MIQALKTHKIWLTNFQEHPATQAINKHWEIGAEKEKKLLLQNLCTYYEGRVSGHTIFIKAWHVDIKAHASLDSIGSVDSYRMP